MKTGMGRDSGRLEDRVIISVAGKGGTGKTTIAVLILKALIEETSKTILFVDADPSTNAPVVLSMPVKKTVGEVIEEFRKTVLDTTELTVDKSRIVEKWVMEVLMESPRFDLLAMGRGEGEGCYCYVNSVLTSILDKLAGNYDVVIMDMEAGLEHISRRTDRDVDIMFVITDPSRMSIETARRIKELIPEVHVEIRRLYVIGNKIPYEEFESYASKVGEFDLQLIGVVPPDPEILNFSVKGLSLLNIPDNSPSYEAVKKICRKVGLI
ncbi:MAG: AAA family ATPase [Candidatus Bathyarchaeia archaeon]